VSNEDGVNSSLCCGWWCQTSTCYVDTMYCLSLLSIMKSIEVMFTCLLLMVLLRTSYCFILRTGFTTTTEMVLSFSYLVTISMQNKKKFNRKV